MYIHMVGSSGAVHDTERTFDVHDNDKICSLKATHVDVANKISDMHE